MIGKKEQNKCDIEKQECCCAAPSQADSLAGKDKAAKPEVKQGKDKMIKVRNSEYQQLVSELAEAKDRNVRLYAEFDNARKRFERDKVEFIKFANEGLVVEFLNILDDLERSVAAANNQNEDNSAFLKGVEMVMSRIYEMLKKNDVKPMKCVGKIFDPHLHEILMQEETAVHDDGLVVEEFQKGYYLGGRVVRTAKVKVAVNSKKESEGDQSEAVDDISDLE